MYIVSLKPMAKRVPIFLTAKRKANFDAAPFEAKACFIFMCGVAIFLLYVLALSFTNGAEYVSIFLPAGAFIGLFVRLSARLVFREQSLKQQIYTRIYLISMMLLSAILFICQPLGFRLLDSKTPEIIARAYLYKNLYLAIVYVFWMIVLSVRLAPLTLKYYRLKHQKNNADIA